MADKYEIGYYNEDTGEENPAIEQGSTFLLTFTADNFFTDVPTLTGQYRPSLGGTPAVDMTGTVAVVPADPQAGTPERLLCNLTIAADDTAVIPPGSGVWDCELTGSYAGDAAFVFKPLGSGVRAKVKGESTVTP